jgi:hypothetical protein
MRRRIDVESIYGSAVRQIEPLQYGGNAGLTPPSTCPVILDQLLNAPVSDLEAAFSSQQHV